MKLKFLTAFLILALVLPTASAQIIKELPTTPDLDNFTASVPTGAGFVDRVHAEAIKQLPKAPHDKWIDPNGNPYESFYYNNTSSPVEYSSIYFDDYGNKLPAKCRIVLKLVEPYYGLNVSDEPIFEDTTHEIAGNNTSENVTEEETTQEIVSNSAVNLTNEQKEDLVSRLWTDLLNFLYTEEKK